MPISKCVLQRGATAKVLFLSIELKELNSSLTTEEVKIQIKELQAKCSEYKERMNKIQSATNHVTPEEREKVWICVLKRPVIACYIYENSQLENVSDKKNWFLSLTQSTVYYTNDTV